MEKDGVLLVSSAILGIDQETAFINGKVYHIYPPTIRRLVGAVSCLKENKGETVKDIIFNSDLDGLCNALSWFIQGDTSLHDEFYDSPVGEVQEAALTAFTLIDPQNFIKLSALQRNVRSLIAKPRS